MALSDLKQSYGLEMLDIPDASSVQIVDQLGLSTVTFSNASGVTAARTMALAWMAALVAPQLTIVEGIIDAYVAIRLTAPVDMDGDCGDVRGIRYSVQGQIDNYKKLLKGKVPFYRDLEELMNPSKSGNTSFKVVM